MSTLAHRTNLISRTRQASTAILTAAAELDACAAAWARGTAAQTTDADFTGENLGLVKTDITKALGPALDSLRTLLATPDGKKFEDIAL